MMKLVWCPETATRAYVDAVKVLAEHDLGETDVAELISAMAGGWKAQLIVEASPSGGSAATTLGLQAAARHTGGRHVRVVPEQHSVTECMDAMRRAGMEEVAAAAGKLVTVGEKEEVMRELEGVDFMVVDWRRRDAVAVLREARPGPRGMVVVCKGGGGLSGRAAGVVKGVPGMRVVRSAFLPIEGGVEVVHVGVGKGPSLDGGRGRWIRHVDKDGEEHLFRR